ncbi:MAG: NAD(P)-dependent oxidoreductase, partial [Caulobacterales bacterium]
ADILMTPLANALAAQGHHIGRFKTTADFRAQPDALRKSDVIVTLDVIDRAILRQAPNLRALVSPATGTEHLDEAAATELGVLVVNGQIPENSFSMSEAAALFILAALYDLNGAQDLLCRPAGDTRRPHRPRMLMGKTVGLIGFGQIAQGLALRLSTWGVSMLAAVRTPRPLPDYVRAAPLETLLVESDVVVVLTPFTDETRGMLSPERLALMKEDAVFVNVARGGIADDDALAALAKARPNMRVALDVFSPEPLRINSPLRDLPNAILTPHAIGNTAELFSRLPVAMLENIQRLLKGELPDCIRNPAIIDSWLRRWRS